MTNSVKISERVLLEQTTGIALISVCHCYAGYTNLKNNAEVVASIERGDHLMLILKPFQSLSFGTGQGFSSSMGQTMK